MTQLEEPYLEATERDSVEGSPGNTRRPSLLQQTIGQTLWSAGDGDTQWEVEGSGWIISESGLQGFSGDPWAHGYGS